MDNGHLSIEEIEQLSRQNGPAESQSHLADCRQCHLLLENYQAVGARLAQLSSFPIGARNGMNCPDPKVWFDVAAGTLSSEESLKYVQHAAECGSCGPRLRAATQVFEEQLTAEEEGEITALPSAGVKQQKKLAQQLAQNESSRTVEILKKSKRSFWPFSFSLAAGTVVVIAAFLSRGLYLRYEVSGAERLVAAEYQKGRPMQYRVAGVPYGPFRQERGGASIPPSIEVPDHKRHPVLAAQAALLELDPKSAIKVLEAAKDANSKSAAAMNNLVVAYAMDADRAGSDEGYKQALRVADEIVSSTPTDPIVYFNRALILERLSRNAEAQAAAQQFFALEHDINWREEAAKILQSP